MGYRSMLSAVFRSVLPEISTSTVIHDLLRSFRVKAPIRSVTPPSWDLLKVLEFLKCPVFEPLNQVSLRDLTRKTLFLTALASAKRVSELQALSRTVSFSSSAAAVSYVPEFLAKTESAVRPLPRTFAIQSLSDFAAGLPDEMLLCPVRALSEYVARRHALSTGLEGSLCRLVVLLAQCQKMAFLTYCERLLCTLEPAPMMLLPLRPIVFAALRHHLHFLRTGLV